MAGTVIKRLHISGLTPNLTSSDIYARFSAFGIVTNISGFGLLDANGNPRKFAYLTLETTEDKLRRCLSGLSGTVWKGAKLRIGDARPDYKEKLRKEREDEQDTREVKRQKLHRHSTGVFSHNMDLITVSNADERKSWKLDPITQTLLRPMRMRPSHPIHRDFPKIAPRKKNRKRTLRLGPIVKIDPSLWGNPHLRASDFELINQSSQGQDSNSKLKDVRFMETSDPAPGLEAPMRSRAETAEKQTVSFSKEIGSSLVISSSNEQTSPPTQDDETEISIAEEKSRSLRLLYSMFGDSEDWCKPENRNNSEENDLETSKTQSNSIVDDHTEETNLPGNADGLEKVVEEPREAHISSETKTKKSSLKDMFKPQEPEGTFSLFDDFQLELDPTISDLFSKSGPGATAETAISTQPVSTPESTNMPQRHAVGKRDVITLDPSLPFFFPCPEIPSKNIADILESKLKVKFCRSETAEEIRKRWNEVKGDLTRDWKKRHREAVKARRQKGMKDL